MIYLIKENIEVSQDRHRIISFNKETVALSYEVLSKSPTTRKVELALIAVDKETGEKVYTFATRTFEGEEYSFINSLFDADGNLTEGGLQYSLDNFKIGDVPLSQIIEGPIELPYPIEPTQQ